MNREKLVLDAFIPYRISYTSNLIADGLAYHYDALFNLKIPEWRIIALVAEHDGITQQEIGLRSRMDKAVVSGIALLLAGRGLLTRRNHPEDGRSRLLSLSAAGKRLYDAVVPKALELERRLFAGFSGVEVDMFVEMLRRLEDVAVSIEREGPASRALLGD